MTEIKVIVDDEGHDVDAVFEEKIEVGGGGGIEKETDPTVPDWAKQEEKPEYTYEEIKEKPTLVEDIDASVDEEKLSLTLILKSKDGGEIATKTIELPMQDLTDYVKNTDYATAIKAGVFTVNAYGFHGLTMIDNGTRLAVSGASNTDIDNATSVFKPIVANNYKYAVKKAITTNTETWTDDEMQSARDLIGAVGKTEYATADKAGVFYWSKERGLEMANDKGLLTIYTPSELDIRKRTESSTKYSRTALTLNRIGYAVMSSLSDGKDTTLWTDDSTVDGQVVKGTKTKALELLGAVQSVKESEIDGSWFLYGTDEKGARKLYKVLAGVGANFIPIRDGWGGLPVPNATKDNHATPKSYVDNLPDNLTLTDDEKAKWCGMFGATKLYLHTISVENSTEKLYIVSKNKSQYRSSTSFFSANKSDVISITDGKIDTIKIVFPKNGYQLHRVYLDEDLSVKTELSVFNTTWNDTVTEL